ncbi:hypothetical protein [Hymenobacter translucens]|nr:hypothetical protein [Hymenobacter translucens]
MKIEVIYVTPAMAFLGITLGSIIEMNIEAAEEWIAKDWGRPA